MTQDRTSDSPLLFLGISQAYLHAFQVIWKEEFASQNRFNWDVALLFHPVSHLLGVSVETALKGLISCYGKQIPRTHDLEKLLKEVTGEDLLQRLDLALFELPVPEDILEANPKQTKGEIEGFYRAHYFHFEMLNRLYNRPYATRYPVLGGHVLPDALAVGKMAAVLLDRLAVASRNWRPDRDGR